ncbi:MAG: hypothetical protein ACTHJ7_03760 [Candidatus Nitrosocosmicus sp.]
MGIICSSTNSYPKCALHFEHPISTLIPSGPGSRFIALGKLSSNLGHPYPASNLPLDEKRGALLILQIYNPSSLKYHILI